MKTEITPKTFATAASRDRKPESNVKGQAAPQEKPKKVWNPAAMYF